MRILLACEFYYPSVGGVQEVMRQLGERFAGAGHDVIVATTYLRDRPSGNINGVDVEEFRVSGNLVSGIEGEFERYRAYVLRQDYDILMIKAAQQWTFDALVPLLGSIRKPKVFIPCGFSGLFDRKYSEYFQRMPSWLREFDRLIFYASDYRDINFARRHGLTNVAVLSNGADEREFNVERDTGFRARYNIPQDAFVVMTVGSLTGLKGHIEVARAFENCNFPRTPVCLLLIGNAPRPLGFGRRFRPKLEKWVNDAKTMHQIGGPVRVAKWLLRPLLIKMRLGWLLRWLGYSATEPETLNNVLRRINAIPGRQAVVADLPRGDVIQAYLNSDLFAFASRIEYSPLVLFEAAAAGLPFVSVPVGNATEIAEWTRGGVICAAPVDGRGYTQVDPAVLASKMEWLAAQPELLEQLSAEGRRNWEERFSWNTIFRSYERILEECLQRRPV